MAYKQEAPRSVQPQRSGESFTWKSKHQSVDRWLKSLCNMIFFEPRWNSNLWVFLPKNIQLQGFEIRHRHFWFISTYVHRKTDIQNQSFRALAFILRERGSQQPARHWQFVKALALLESPLKNSRQCGDKYHVTVLVGKTANLSKNCGPIFQGCKWTKKQQQQWRRIPHFARQYILDSQALRVNQMRDTGLIILSIS